MAASVQSPSAYRSPLPLVASPLAKSTYRLNPTMSIMKALSSARAGDVIYLAAGHYKESVSICMSVTFEVEPEARRVVGTPLVNIESPSPNVPALRVFGSSQARPIFRGIAFRKPVKAESPVKRLLSDIKYSMEKQTAEARKGWEDVLVGKSPISRHVPTVLLTGYSRAQLTECDIRGELLINDQSSPLIQRCTLVGFLDPVVPSTTSRYDSEGICSVRIASYPARSSSSEPLNQTILRDNKIGPCPLQYGCASVCIEDGSSRVLLDHNIIDSTGGTGYSLLLRGQLSNVIVSKNKISSAPKSCIQVECFGKGERQSSYEEDAFSHVALIESNEIQHAKEFGVFILEGSSCSLRQNEVFGNGLFNISAPSMYEGHLDTNRVY